MSSNSTQPGNIESNNTEEKTNDIEEKTNNLKEKTNDVVEKTNNLKEKINNIVENNNTDAAVLNGIIVEKDVREESYTYVNNVLTIMLEEIENDDVNNKKDKEDIGVLDKIKGHIKKDKLSKVKKEIKKIKQSKIVEKGGYLKMYRDFFKTIIKIHDIDIKKEDPGGTKQLQKKLYINLIISIETLIKDLLKDSGLSEDYKTMNPNSLSFNEEKHKYNILFKKSIDEANNKEKENTNVE